MSKSKSLSPGAYDLLNGSTTHFTWSGVKPICLATAYATPLSKPLPLLGSLWMNHGANAGSSVAIVRVPGVLRFNWSIAQGSPAPVVSPPDVSAVVGVVSDDVLSSCGEHAASAATTRAAEAASAGPRQGR